jgi:hypothetical protein
MNTTNNTDQTFVLVEMTVPKERPSDVAVVTSNVLMPEGFEFDATPRIKRIVRTYYGRNRANEDLDLALSLAPDSRFEIVEVENIDA